jgi:hypothetical protein
MIADRQLSRPLPVSVIAALLKTISNTPKQVNDGHQNGH